MSTLQSALLTMDLPALMTMDLHEVFRTMGTDILLFVSAMVAFAVVHHMKTARGKKACKESSTLVAADKVAANEDKLQLDLSTIEEEETTAPVEREPKQPQHQSAVHLEQCKAEQQFSVSAHLALMKKYAAERNIKDTLCTFELIKQSGTDLTSSMYNTVMRAWIKCGNIWAAEEFMEEVKTAGMADADSYLIIIKALLVIRDLENAKGVLHDMSEAGVAPTAAAFDELIGGFARGGLFKEGIILLNEMHAASVQPSGFTLDTIADLMNSARRVNQSCAEMRQTLVKYGLQPGDMLISEPSEIPRLVAVIFQADFFRRSAAYVHTVEIKGSLIHLEAVRRTLQQHGCCDPLQATNTNGACSLDDCYWELDQPLHVSIDDAQTSLLSPSMTRTLRDAVQDKAYQTRSTVVIRSVSKSGLCLPTCVENVLMRYLGNDLYYLHMYFESHTPRADIFDAISCRHPRVGVRHCWAQSNVSACGQRTLVNGDETDEACFNRHLSALRLA